MARFYGPWGRVKNAETYHDNEYKLDDEYIPESPQSNNPNINFSIQ